jgi:hypothetical protein
MPPRCPASTQPSRTIRSRNPTSSGNQLRAAFVPVMEQAIPERLVAAAQAGPASFRTRAREWFAAATAPRGMTHRFAVPALTMALGLLVGIGLEQGPQTIADFQISPSSGRLVAKGAVADVLEHQLAAETQTGAIHVAVSYRDKSGDICRSFESSGASSVDAVACRHDGEWQVGTMVSVPKTEPSGTYGLAGSAMPPAISEAISSSIAGEPLDATAEKAARDSGWK